MMLYDTMYAFYVPKTETNLIVIQSSNSGIPNANIRRSHARTRIFTFPKRQ